jgi:16S rRNA (cytidine1402-2'-O)-methyltransferase
MRTGILYVVSTPIGNLEDITLRALKILREVELIAAEDTRRTNRLLRHYGIDTLTSSYHSYNLSKKTPILIKKLLEGENIAIVSDSGTPGISDPGGKLIREAIKKDIKVTAIPGAAAFLTALVSSGLDTGKFVFEGFLSNKKNRRKNQLAYLKDEKRTIVIYESPHRIKAFLEDFIDIYGNRQLAVARELTKTYEDVLRGSAREILNCFADKKPKGEFVIVF